MSPGRIRSTLTSGRSASTPLPAGLATCPWFTLSFAWTRCSSKIRCQSCARSTKTWKGLEMDGQKGHGRWGEASRSGAKSQGSPNQPSKTCGVRLGAGHQGPYGDGPWWTVVERPLTCIMSKCFSYLHGSVRTTRTGNRASPPFGLLLRKDRFNHEPFGYQLCCCDEAWRWRHPLQLSMCLCITVQGLLSWKRLISHQNVKCKASKPI